MQKAYTSIAIASSSSDDKSQGGNDSNVGGGRQDKRDIDNLSDNEMREKATSLFRNVNVMMMKTPKY